jgi:hypothetical protein
MITKDRQQLAHQKNVGVVIDYVLWSELLLEKSQAWKTTNMLQSYVKTQIQYFSEFAQEWNQISIKVFV